MLPFWSEHVGSLRIKIHLILIINFKNEIFQHLIDLTEDENWAQITLEKLKLNNKKKCYKGLHSNIAPSKESSKGPKPLDYRKIIVQTRSYFHISNLLPPAGRVCSRMRPISQPSGHIGRAGKRGFSHGAHERKKIPHWNMRDLPRGHWRNVSSGHVKKVFTNGLSGWDRRAISSAFWICSALVTLLVRRNLTFESCSLSAIYPTLIHNFGTKFSRTRAHSLARQKKTRKIPNNETPRVMTLSATPLQRQLIWTDRREKET